MSRREFLVKTLHYLLPGIAAILLLYPVAVFTTFRRIRKREIIFEEKDLLGETNYKDTVYITRQGSELRAVSGRCTHLGCLVNFNPITRRFECPCHGSVYDLQGKRISGPTTKDLKALPFNLLADGRVSVTLEM